MYEAVSGNGLLPDWHQAISPVSEPMLTYWFCCCYGPVLCISWIVQIKICIMYFLNWANKDMFKLNLKYPIIWLICLLRYIKFELNWIGIERKELNWNWIERFWIRFELELNWIEKSWIQLELELNWIERNELIRALQVTSFTIVYSIVYSGADQRKHQSSGSLAFVWGI